MPIRNLDPDDDYAYHWSNRGVPPRERGWTDRRNKTSLVTELEQRAQRCASFNQHPNPLLYGVCTNCNAPKYAHTTQALRKEV